MKFKSDIEVQAGLKDSSGSIGASGQVLSSTGSNVSWINQTTIANDVQNLVKAGVAITKGQAVYVTGADGTNIIVGLASNTSEATSSKTLGLLNSNVSINGMADVVQIGRLSGLNTIGATAGDPVWLGTNGNLIYGLANKPYAPAHLVFIGIVTRVNANNGEIFINVQNGFELKEIHDVDIITNVPINGDLLGYDGTLWVNKTIAEWLGYTPANASGTTNYVSKFTGSTSLGNSQIFDNGTNVGIGTTSPLQKLHVEGLSYFGSDIFTLNNGGIFFSGNNSYQRGIYSNASGLTLQTLGSPKVTITDGGNVLIGSSSDFGAKLSSLITSSASLSSVAPVLRLMNQGSGYIPKIILTDNTNSDATISFIPAPAGNSTLSFGIQGTIVNYQTLNIKENGNVGIGTTSPNEKLEVQNGTSGAKIKVSNTGGGYASLECSSNASSVAQLSFTNQLSLIGGNVGIGTTSPGFATAGRTVLTLNGSSTSLMEFQSGGAFKSYFYQSGTSFEIYETNTLTIAVGGSERMRVANNGNVGIGTTSPSAKLNVYGDLHLGAYSNLSTVNFENRTGKGIFVISTNGVTNAAGTTITYSWADGGHGPLKFNNASSEVMRLSANGNVGINTAAPIHKLSVNGKIGGDVYADSFVEFTATTETIVSADGNVVLGYAQNVVVDNEGSVGVGTIAPESCAALEVKSLSQGFLPPRMRTGDRDGITNPVPGLMIFNEDTETIDVFTSLLGWRSLLF